MARRSPPPASSGSRNYGAAHAASPCRTGPDRHAGCAWSVRSRIHRAQLPAEQRLVGVGRIGTGVPVVVHGVDHDGQHRSDAFLVALAQSSCPRMARRPGSSAPRRCATAAIGSVGIATSRAPIHGAGAIYGTRSSASASSALSGLVPISAAWVTANSAWLSTCPVRSRNPVAQCRHSAGDGGAGQSMTQPRERARKSAGVSAASIARSAVATMVADEFGAATSRQ